MFNVAWTLRGEVLVERLVVIVVFPQELRGNAVYIKSSYIAKGTV